MLTFGYNANIRAAGSVSTTVLDFAKDLLFDLKYAKDEQKEALHMGNVSKSRTQDLKTSNFDTRCLSSLSSTVWEGS